MYIKHNFPSSSSLLLIIVVRRSGERFCMKPVDDQNGKSSSAIWIKELFSILHRSSLSLLSWAKHHNSSLSFLSYLPSFRQQVVSTFSKTGGSALTRPRLSRKLGCYIESRSRRHLWMHPFRLLEGCCVCHWTMVTYKMASPQDWSIHCIYRQHRSKSFLLSWTPKKMTLNPLEIRAIVKV